jgi:hypothetical protein
LTLPPNAYLDYSGGDWTCAEDFHKQDKGCVAD